MSQNDNDIREALRKIDDDAAWDPMDDIALRDILISNFRGRMKWASLLVWVYGLLFTGVAVYAAWRFFTTDAVRDYVLWAVVFIMSMLIVIVTKLWYWMLANRNSLHREVKRLELQVAALLEKLDR